MADYFIYRVNGGEVMTVSTESHASQLNSFFSEVVDPNTPDGKDLSVKKIYVNGTVRNATAQEISNFSVAANADDNIVARTSQSLLLDSNNRSGIVHKAIAQIVIDEINILRKWLRDFKVEVAASTNLANFQSRVATLSTLADRTPTQARAAIKSAISSGDND